MHQRMPYLDSICKSYKGSEFCSLVMLHAVFLIFGSFSQLSFHSFEKFPFEHHRGHRNEAKYEIYLTHFEKEK